MKMGISYGTQWVYHKVINLVKSFNPFGRRNQGKEIESWVIEYEDDSEGNLRYGSVHSSNSWAAEIRHESESPIVTNASCVNENGVIQLDLDSEMNGLRMLIHENSCGLPWKIDGVKSSFDRKIEPAGKCLQRLHLLGSYRKRELIKQDLVEECFRPLTEEEDIEITRALSNFSRRKVLVIHENSNIEITGVTLQCLCPRAWLNDEVINLYFELLKERENREPQKFLKCHFFNTFFYKKLTSDGYGYKFQSVRRWTSKKNIGYEVSECDKIFVPIHKQMHWCLAIINKKDKKFQYLDSLMEFDPQVLHVLAKYYVDEVKDKSGFDIDVSSWEYEYVSNLPKQENGYDCGVFMIKYADFLSRDIELCFNQLHIPYFRRRTIKEILNLRAD